MTNKPDQTDDYSKFHNNSEFKRLTVDVPVELHRAIKSQCALRGTKIANEIRELLAIKYG